MKINEIPGWPPRQFQAVHVKKGYAPPIRSLLFIEDVSIVPGPTAEEGSDVFILLQDRATGQSCSTRVRIKDARKAVDVARTLTNCRGLSLSIVGGVKIATGRPNPVQA